MYAKQLIRIIVLVLLSLSFFHTSALASPTPPPSILDEKTVFSAVSGVAITPGWNYLKLGATACSVATVFDEIQADAGGGVRIDSLWVGTGTSILMGQTWKEYMATDEKSTTSIIPAASKLALYTASRFYLDMNEDSCDKERPAKQKAQIDQAREVAVQTQPPVAPPPEKISWWTRLTRPITGALSWMANAWTGGIMMVWNPVAGAIGKIMKR